MDLNELLSTMSTELTAANDDAAKFNNGNISAGTRVRKNMQAIKVLAQSVRTRVQELKSNA